MMRWTAALAALCLAWPCAGLAAPPNVSPPFRTVVLIVPDELEDKEITRQLTRILRVETQRNAQYNLLDTRDLSLVDALALQGCEEPTPQCMDQLAESLEADRVIFSQLVTVGGFQDLEVNIYDRAQRRVVARWDRRFSKEVDMVGFFAREMSSFLGGRAADKPTALRISCNVPNAEVLVDGRRVGRTPYLGERFEPGRHEIVVTQEGYTSWRRSVDLLEGEGRLYSVTLRPLDAAERAARRDAPGSPPQAPSESLRTYGWVMLGSGGLFLGAGAVFGVLAGLTHDELEATSLEVYARDLEDRGRLQAGTANVLYTVGGLSVLTGAVLLIWHGLGEEAPPQGGGPALAPLPEGGALLRWEGAW